jgi:iron complex outermembrane receptor protein
MSVRLPHRPLANALFAALFALPAAALAATPPAPPREDAPHDRERARTLDELVVTASPLQPGSEDVIQPVEVIAGEELDARKAGTLGETVSHAVGVQSSFFGAGVGRPVIRGQEGARVQVLAGGLGALDASTISADHAVAIEPFLADQIEILKGPATLLYGSGAVGGAVNVVDGRIPEALPEALGGRAELRGNTGADERTGLFRLDGAAAGWAWHADAFRREVGDYEIPGFAESDAAHHEGPDDEAGEGAFGTLPNSALTTEGGALGASWIGAGGFLGASIGTYRSDYGIPGHAHEPDHDAGAGDDGHDEAAVRIDLEQTRHDVHGAWFEPFGGAESLRLRLAHSDYRHLELEGREVGTRFDNEGVEGRLELVHAPIAKWHGAAGLQFGRRDFAAQGEEAFVPPSVSRDLGLFLLEERSFGRWKLEGGLRHDRLGLDPDGGARARDFHASSASFGVSFELDERLHLSAGFDRAERAPTTEELYSDGVHVATQSFERGDDALDTEVANQFELGAHLHVGPLSGKLSVYETRYDDFIYLAATGGELESLPVRAWTQADATFRGVEAEATLRLADNASGRWDLRLFGDKVRATLDAGGPLPRIVPARVGASLQWERDGWRASLGALRHDDQPRVAAFETPTPGYTLYDAHLARHWDGERFGWEVFVDATNLTDREARVHTSFLKDLAPLPGRSIAFGVRGFF